MDMQNVYHIHTIYRIFTKKYLQIFKNISYWFLNRMVLVNLCLREGSFLWTTISVNLLLYVFKRSSAYFSVTNLNNVVKWSASMLREWSKKCSLLWSNTAEPNCSTTALWIAALRFLSKQMPFPCSITLRQKMNSIRLQLSSTQTFDLTEAVRSEMITTNVHVFF